MDLWTLIHKENKEFIRYNIIYLEGDIGVEYYFYDKAEYNKYFPIWVTDDFSSFEKIFNSPTDYDSMEYKFPGTYKIDINQYEIFKLN